MSNIDQEIREALMAGDSEELQELGTEQNLFEMTMGTFRGRNRWWTVYGVVLMFALMAVAVFFDIIVSLLRVRARGALAGCLIPRVMRSPIPCLDWLRSPPRPSV